MKNPVRHILSFVLPLFSAVVIKGIVSLFGQWGDYYGVAEYGYNLISLIFYVAGVYLLERMLADIDKRRAVVSVIGGLLFSASCVFGAYLFFQNDLFLSAAESGLLLLRSVGLSFLTIPL